MQISSRKTDHIQLCVSGDVDFKNKTTLFEEVELIHDALPELALSDIDLRTNFAGVELKAPLLIAAMTGGVKRAEKINKDLASIAEELGIGFAFGSQRPLLEGKSKEGYIVRDVAPSALLLGNIGLVQAIKTSTQQLEDMIGYSKVNALCVHLNPAMEIIQPEGDQDFRGGLDCIQRLVEELSIPIVIKETGSGLSRSVGERIKERGVKWIDTSGSGGTSWVAVETHRSMLTKKRIGQHFWDWGIPTAASVVQNQGLGFGICATGGIKDGLMIAKAIALGACCGGIARPVLQAYDKGGRDFTKHFLEQIIQEIKIAMLLTHSKDVVTLQKAPRIISPKLERWFPQPS